MIMKKLLYLLIIPCVLLSFFSSCKTEIMETDICVYGGTSAGVIAAYSASQLEKTAILIEPTNHLGGLSSGGLGATDIGNKYAVTGIALDFYRKLGKHYNKLESWTFEPHVAEGLFNDYVAKKNIQLIKNYRIKEVVKENNQIKEIILESTDQPFWKPKISVKAKMFIDCSYEGDLMAKAGVSYFVGREANSLYGETLNGVQLLDKHQFPDSIDPYIEKGNPASGLLYGINPDTLKPQGSGDKLVQAYNFRLCLTQDTANMIAVTQPAGYKASNYELLKRLVEYRTQKGIKHDLGIYLSIIRMPGGKTDINNNGPFSTDFINENWNYTEASYDERNKLIEAHENYIKGLLYFLGHDPGMPVELREQMLSWGFAKDEFTDNGGFPHQMYVREARRMIGEYVMTQNNCIGKEVVNDVVGMAAYTMDSHNCQRLVVNGMVKNEGDVQVGGFPPYPISYRSIVPKKGECTNLLVPVCLSATHIAYGSIRMEPVFMVLAQSSAIAASLAIDSGKIVQEIDYELLKEKLNTNPYLDGRIPEVVVDNRDASRIKTTGTWNPAIRWMRQYKSDYLCSEPTEKGLKRISFLPYLIASGSYRVYYYCPEKSTDKTNWPTSVKLLVGNGTKTDTVNIDLHSNSNQWIEVGKFSFYKNKQASLEVVADTVSYNVPADAALWILDKK